MADFPAFDVDGDGTNNGARSTGATFWTEIDDDPAVSQPDADYIYNALNADSDCFCELDDMPGDFDAILTLALEVYTTFYNWTDDTWVLYGQVFAADESTAYTDQIELARKSPGTDTTGLSGPLSFTINATGLAASKAQWNLATLQLAWDLTKLKGNDSADLRLHAVEFTGTYDIAAAEVVLEGQATGTSTAGAALGLEVALVGASDGEAAVVPSLTVEHALETQSDGGSTAGAILYKDVPLAAASAGEATAAAILETGAFVILSGQADGTAAVDAELTTLLALEASSAGVSTVTPDLLIERLLGGVATGAGAVLGALSAERPLAGWTDGVANVLAALGKDIPLEAQADGTATVSGALSTDSAIALAGSVVGVSTASAALSAARALYGQSGSLALISGELAISRELAGASAGVCIVAGQLTSIEAEIALTAIVATIYVNMLPVARVAVHKPAAAPVLARPSSTATVITDIN